MREQVWEGGRVEDPASRDQDSLPWRGGRFPERVRRTWNIIEDDVIERSNDIDALADAIMEATGQEKARILHRLRVFLMAEGNTEMEDRLIMPGAGPDARPPRR